MARLGIRIEDIFSVALLRTRPCSRRVVREQRRRRGCCCRLLLFLDRRGSSSGGGAGRRAAAPARAPLLAHPRAPAADVGAGLAAHALLGLGVWGRAGD